MKSTPLIFQDFSIAGLRKQWEFQNMETMLGKLEEKVGGKIAHVGHNFTGMKTETRRTRGLDKVNEFAYRWQFEQVTDEHYVFTNSKNYDKVLIKCPYGKIGDEIWVKESYKPLVTGGPEGFNLYDYKADVGSKSIADDIINGWKSPMFMPKAASRIKLEITGLSIERLWDIDEEGPMREGCVFGFAEGDKEPNCKPIDQFINRWKELHGKESLDKNPWVWVIQFTVKEFKQ